MCVISYCKYHDFLLQYSRGPTSFPIRVSRVVDLDSLLDSFLLSSRTFHHCRNHCPFIPVARCHSFNSFNFHTTMPFARRHKDPPKASTRPSKGDAQSTNEKRYVSTTAIFKAASNRVHKRPVPTTLTRKPLNTPKKIRTTILVSSSPPTPRPRIRPLLDDFNSKRRVVVLMLSFH